MNISDSQEVLGRAGAEHKNTDKTDHPQDMDWNYLHGLGGLLAALDRHCRNVSVRHLIVWTVRLGITRTYWHSIKTDIHVSIRHTEKQLNSP